ncbi:two-component system response regulator [Campylobacter blaseri]|nr:two-component system response regulator [Campylobacter blaseri]
MKNTKNLNILIIEDEKDIRESMAKAMEGFFNSIITAQHGDEGVKKFKKFNPDIVITDIAMPIMDGLEMTKIIKELSPQTPIIALSAFSDRDRLLKAIDVGIDKYVLKPIDMEELLSTIENIAKSKINTLNVVDLVNGYKFDQSKKVLIKDGLEISLTKKELSFLMLLINNEGNLVLHNNIKESVWGSESVSDAAVRTFIKRIRGKVGQDTIKNIPGLGYKVEIATKK